ncbi:hypothetical protein [Kiloniella sp. EL199]|uniref:hypothetical protein n=1 Tax=Kiloniella sp. EL199 TaxID=2107581 RepID=UPI000EA31B41|nr:hypothetical protein [Kiloniella sp. EL199]
MSIKTSPVLPGPLRQEDIVTSKSDIGSTIDQHYLNPLLGESLLQKLDDDPEPLHFMAAH